MFKFITTGIKPLEEPRWAGALRLAVAPIMLQPFMVALVFGIIVVVLRGRTYNGMMIKSLILVAIGLACLYVGRRIWWRRPYSLQVPLGLVLAPVYVYGFWLLLSRG
jgi:hypothetical protein